MKFSAKHGQVVLGSTLAIVGLVFCACTGTVQSNVTGEEGGGGQGGEGSEGQSGGQGGNPFAPGGAGGVVIIKTPDEVKFACSDTTPPAASLKKLTMRQLRNSVHDLLRLALKDDATTATAWKTLEPDVVGIPNDLRPNTAVDIHGSFTRLDQATQQGQIDALYKLALNLGKELSRAENRAAVLGACAADADTKNDSTCLDTFIGNFGERVLRHPLSAEEVARFRTIHAASSPFDEAGLTDVVGAMFLSPYFLAFVEHGADAVGGKGNVRALSAYELASALSLHLWESVPDDALWESAKSGDLLTTAGYAKQVDRLLTDPRAQTTFDAFSSEWLRLDELPSFNGVDKNAAFKAMAGGDVPPAGYSSALAADAVDTVRDVFRGGGSAIDLLTTRRSFVTNPTLARIYGSTPWSGSGDPTVLPEGRLGLLGRGFHLTSGTATTRPIVKGVFVRREILCDVIAPPPANAAANGDPVDKTLSIRKQMETLTAKGSCAGCHKYLINGLGFATENFDALGRSRTEEVVLDATTGKSLSTQVVDTNAVAYVTDADDKPVSGLADLVSRIAASGKMPACLARKTMRFSLGRPEDEKADGCALEATRAAFSSSGGLKKGWRTVVMNPEFRQRVFE